MTHESYMEFFRRSINIGRRLKILARENLHRINYTFEEFDVLRVIKADQPVKSSDLAINTGRQKSNVVPILNAFEEKGFIVREKDSNDRRNVWISLTKKGREEKERVQEFQRTYIAGLLSQIDEVVLRDLIKNYDVVLGYLKDIMDNK